MFSEKFIAIAVAGCWAGIIVVFTQKHAVKILVWYEIHIPMESAINYQTDRTLTINH